MAAPIQVEPDRAPDFGIRRYSHVDGREQIYCLRQTSTLLSTASFNGRGRRKSNGLPRRAEEQYDGPMPNTRTHFTAQPPIQRHIIRILGHVGIFQRLEATAQVSPHTTPSCRNTIRASERGQTLNSPRRRLESTGEVGRAEPTASRPPA